MIINLYAVNHMTSNDIKQRRTTRGKNHTFTEWRQNTTFVHFQACPNREVGQRKRMCEEPPALYKPSIFTKLGYSHQYLTSLTSHWMSPWVLYNKSGLFWVRSLLCVNCCLLHSGALPGLSVALTLLAITGQLFCTLTFHLGYHRNDVSVTSSYSCRWLICPLFYIMFLSILSLLPQPPRPNLVEGVFSGPAFLFL